MTVIHRSSIGDILRRSARRHADRLALVFRERSYTYADLDAATDRVAAFLHGLGLVKGDRVAAYGKNSDAYLLLWLGAVRAGLVHVPINYALTGEELAYIVRQSGSRMLFADAPLRDQALAASLPLDLLGTIHGGPADTDILVQAHGEGTADWQADVGDDDVAQLLYTSGTTAAPKGAVLTHRALIHHYASAAMATDLREHERMLHALPLYHSAQMHVFLMPALMTGMSNWLLEAPDPTRVLQTVAEHQIGSFFAAPTVWLALLGLIEPDPIMAATLQKGYYGASIMPLPVLERLRRALPQLGLYNCFGQSEIGPLAAVLRPEEHDSRPASAGRAIPFVDLRVVDDDMQDVPVDEIGEVVYRSPQLCQGYWDMPEETAAAFAGGWFHSGDLARRDEAGYITIVDRKKDVIKTGGIVVSSREVEEALFTHPHVQEVAVIPLPDAKWVEAVTAVVVRQPGATVDAIELQTYARTRLAPFKVPKTVIFVDALPKNGAGKILKRELRDRFADG